jgi:hypothetical protein
MHRTLSLAIFTAVCLLETRYFVNGDIQLQGSDEDLAIIDTSEPSNLAQRQLSHLPATSDLVWRTGTHVNFSSNNS